LAVPERAPQYIEAIHVRADFSSHMLQALETASRVRVEAELMQSDPVAGIPDTAPVVVGHCKLEADIDQEPV